MVSFLFFAIAALLNAFMDRISEGRFGYSIFSKLDPKFWYAWESWKHAKKVFNYPIDAWHIGKSCMILCLGLAVWFHREPKELWEPPVYWALWVIVFNLSYNHLLKRKVKT